MISSIDIRNFRLFKNLSIKSVSPINLIVGDNGAGKTSLLEAVFLTLSGSTQTGANLKGARAGNTVFQGTAGAFVDSVYLELFHNMDYSNSPSISLHGTGPEARSLVIEKGGGSTRLAKGKKISEATADDPIRFRYTSATKKKVVSTLNVENNGIVFKGTGEALPNFYYFSAFSTYTSAETAERFSHLSVDQRRLFVERFSKIFGWISNIVVKASGGSSALWADVKVGKKAIEMPLSAVSGGANRIAAILMGMINRRKNVVLIDEVENGVFYEKYELVARLLLEFSREMECQLFLSTHSQEWVRAFTNAAKQHLEEVSLWRIKKGDDGPEVRQFAGRTIQSGIAHGIDIRSGGSD
jgi:ABC-type lipoprotein export system ATPase subunit